ncbi:MAG TPA: hypothetical protein VJT31_17665, partial [Rugosimonospora sp.]|nr:hypothetical protein [Rugosimonospora sp.]
LRRVGLQWPTGDPARLAAAGDAWLAFATTLRGYRANADTAASSVWGTNAGETVDAFRGWWGGTDGPSANLAQAEQAAQRIGTALHAAATLLTTTRSALTTQIAPAAPVLDSTDPAVQAQAASLVPPLSAAGARINGSAGSIAQRIIILLFQALLKEALRPRPQNPPTSTTPKPRPNPQPVPPPLPDWLFPRPNANNGPDCKTPPPANVKPILVGNVTDPETNGTGILRIEARTGPEGERITIIDGIVKDSLPASDRAGYEKKWWIIRDSMGLSGSQYDAAHLWGPVLGSEAAAGILLAPQDANRSYTKIMENYVQGLRDYAGPGGWVELHAVATSQRPSAWSPPQSPQSGYNLLANLDFTPTVCRPGSPPEFLPSFGINVPRPFVDVNGNLQPKPVQPYADPGARP